MLRTYRQGLLFGFAKTANITRPTLDRSTWLVYSVYSYPLKRCTTDRISVNTPNTYISDYVQVPHFAIWKTVLVVPFPKILHILIIELVTLFCENDVCDIFTTYVAPFNVITSNDFQYRTKTIYRRDSSVSLKWNATFLELSWKPVLSKYLTVRNILTLEQWNIR